MPPPLPDGRAGASPPPSPKERTTSSGVGRSAAYAMRTSTISAAATGRADACTSAMPFISICQVRDRTRMDSLVAKSRPRVRSASDSDTSSATDGITFTRVTKCVNSARSDSTTAGSAPMSYCARSSPKAAAISPFMRCSNRSTMRTRSARPSICRTSSATTLPAAWAMAWSSSERLSRTEPSAARAISASAASSISTLSFAAMPARCLTSTAVSTRRRSKRWQRDRTVTGTLPISVVAKMNLACGGGSSSVFSSALNAAVDSMCTSSRM